MCATDVSLLRRAGSSSARSQPARPLPAASLLAVVSGERCAAHACHRWVRCRNSARSTAASGSCARLHALREAAVARFRERHTAVVQRMRTTSAPPRHRPPIGRLPRPARVSVALSRSARGSTRRFCFARLLMLLRCCCLPAPRPQPCHADRQPWEAPGRGEDFTTPAFKEHVRQAQCTTAAPAQPSSRRFRPLCHGTGRRLHRLLRNETLVAGTSCDRRARRAGCLVRGRFA